MALGAVGLHVIFALQLGGEILAPGGLGHVAGEGLGPELILAVTVFGFEAAALAVVADGAAEIGEFVAALPVAVALHVAHGGRVRVRLEGLRVAGKARIVGGDVAGGAAVHASIAEAGDDGLLDARGTGFEFRAVLLVFG